MNRKNQKGGSDGDRRIHRVEKEIREVIGMYLISGFRGELPGLVSVTRVIVSRDLRTAKILVSVLVNSEVGVGGEIVKPSDESIATARQSAVRELQDRAYEIQDEINHKLRMRSCPRLTFFYDDGYDHAMKVDNVLRTLNQKSTGSDSGPKGED